MKEKVFEILNVEPAYMMIMIFILFVLMIILFLLYVSVNMKYNRLKSSYNSFMKGKDGKTLEKSLRDRFEAVEELEDAVRKNTTDVKEVFHDMKNNYQKVGIVKYDAFNEMGGKLSFVLTLLDGNNSGFVLNAMHSREGCYTYIKEIVRGESYIELSEEESQSLEKAIFQEVYDPEIQSIMK